ncbi:MAG: translational GTPase TypA [Phycisphaerales bacterium]|nr:translational GTPase TypA [Phycisphaerales bacterium]
MSVAQQNLRNVAIIAHVDHGKTTLVDAMLRASSAAGEVETGAECVLDSNPLERERGITILSKNCAVEYTVRFGPRAGESLRVNIIDTPGHADFGGEVERVLRMADGCLILIDAMEGPMPQTRFVLSKALEVGLKPIVVVNKCDRPDARPQEVVNEVFDLLIDLGADDLALDFPVVWASGRDGWASRTRDDRSRGVDDLFAAIAERVPAPTGDPEASLQFLVVNLDSNDYVGRLGIGRVFAGTLRANSPVTVCKADGSVQKARVQGVKRFEGLSRVAADSIAAGDLCLIEGITDIQIGDTVCAFDRPIPMTRVRVDDPTLHMVFRINDGPLGGREGKFVTSRQIAERLERELRSNVALRVAPGDSTEEFHVSGRGLLHLGVLLETMRREGFELTVGKPEVIEREIDGVKCEPYERLALDVVQTAMGPALELLGQRGAEITKVEMRGTRTHVEADIPARGLIGLRTRILNATGGESVMHHSFSDYRPVRFAPKRRSNGVMVAVEAGTATTFSLLNLAERGFMFVSNADVIYEGMVVGEHNRDNDLHVNVVKAKPMSNVRESSKEATVVLKAPRPFTLESALEYLEGDEYVEITPSAVRIRKKILREADRRRINRQMKDREAAAVSAETSA